MDVPIKKSSFLEIPANVLAVICVAVVVLVLLSIFFCCLCIPKCLLHQHKVVLCLNFQISIKASYSHHQQRCTNSFYTNFTITQFEKVPIPHLTRTYYGIWGLLWIQYVRYHIPLLIKIRCSILAIQHQERIFWRKLIDNKEIDIENGVKMYKPRIIMARVQ